MNIEGIIESPSRNNLHRARDISNELFWVFVALIIQNEKCICRILLSSINY